MCVNVTTLHFEILTENGKIEAKNYPSENFIGIQ